MHSYEEVVTKLEEIVASKPEGYKYTTDQRAIDALRGVDDDNIFVDSDGDEYVGICSYRFPDETPACIVGHLLYYYDPEYLPKEGDLASSVALHLSLDDTVLNFLDTLQENQDGGETWDKALKLAKETYFEN